jgi:transcriptional regulator with XRE-family HTH domain
MPKQTVGKLQKRKLGRTFFREWRRASTMTLAAAAKQIGIDRSHLGRIERGASGYHQRLLERAAEVYGCAPFALLSYAPEDGAAVLESVAHVIGLKGD